MNIGVSPKGETPRGVLGIDERSSRLKIELLIENQFIHRF